MNYHIVPKGYNILVEPIDAKKPEGDIILLEDTKDKEQRATTTGTVLAIGDYAWVDFPDSKAQAKVGDVVIFKAHTGMRVKNKEEDKDFLLLMRDVDVAGIVEGES